MWLYDSTMREFTDPFTGDVLDNPTPKTYRVEYSVNGGRKSTWTFDTLAEKRPTKADAKQKMTDSVQFMNVSKGDITVHSVSKIDGFM